MRVGKLGLSVPYGPSDESQPCGDQIYHRLLSTRLQGADQPFGQNCQRVAVLVNSMVAWNAKATVGRTIQIGPFSMVCPYLRR